MHKVDICSNMLLLNMYVSEANCKRLVSVLDKTDQLLRNQDHEGCGIQLEIRPTDGEDNAGRGATETHPEVHPIIDLKHFHTFEGPRFRQGHDNTSKRNLQSYGLTENNVLLKHARRFTPCWKV